MFNFFKSKKKQPEQPDQREESAVTTEVPEDNAEVAQCKPETWSETAQVSQPETQVESATESEPETETETEVKEENKIK